MYCAKCNGRVFIDRVFSQKLHIEIFCIVCGKRYMLNKETNVLGKWLDQIEQRHAKNFSTFS